MTNLKRVICLTLSLIIGFSVFFCLSGVTSAAYPSDIPIIYMHGMGSPLVIRHEDGSVEEPGTMAVDSDAILSKLSENTDIIAKAFFTQDWSDFCDLVEDIMVSSFGSLALGPDGMPVDGSESSEEYTLENVQMRYYNYEENLNKYRFFYDWRLDPMDNMERLHDYAEKLLQVTGSDKYAICGRCEGACLALAYWETYHDPRISDIIFYASAAKGAIPIGESFSGRMKVDPDAVERFVYEADLGINYELNENITFTDATLNQILRTVSDMYGLDYACWAVNNVYGQIYKSVTPRALKQTFGTFPGFWAMCDDEYFEDAKKVMFGGEEEKYSVFIDKIDNYHYNIMNRAEEIIQNAVDSGVEVSNVVKYGFQSYPVSKSSNLPSDVLCRVDQASFGATCTEIGKKLSDSHIVKSVETGNSSYISPDLTIDASTSILKDTTWFIKNLKHDEFPDSVDALMFEIVREKGLKADKCENFSRYLYYDKDNDQLVSYKTDENKNKLDDYVEENSNDFFRKIKPLFKIFYGILVLITKLLTLPART